MEELGLTISHHTLMYLSRRDRIRNMERARRVKETHKRRRRQMTVQTQVAESSRRRRDKKVYASAQFGSEIIASSDESDTLCDSCKARHCPLVAKSKKDNWISCEACTIGSTGPARGSSRKGRSQNPFSVVVVVIDRMYIVVVW